MYCPISGRFSFSYESEAEGAVCPGTSSQLSSNCPYGFGLHLHFRGCSFQQNLSKACKHAPLLYSISTLSTHGLKGDHVLHE